MGDEGRDLLRYEGRGKALRVMGLAAAVGVPALLLMLWLQRTFPDQRKLLKLGALPLAVAFVVFYAALLQLLFGERLSGLVSQERKELSGAQLLLVPLILLPFAGFVMVLVGWLARAR